MGSVDDRVVSMQFDNKTFEARIAATIGSLDRLKGSLDFSNTKRGIDDLTAANRGFQLDGIASAIENISTKFSMFGALAFTVLQNVVNRAFDAGVSLVKALTLDQVMGGFQEYETNMNSIQTVLANTKADGTNLQDVNSALDQLNQYSDQTIYNFSEMARNIGTFTAAGVKLDTSVSSIKGIANLAAISGSNSQQASTAMYQLSQAIATGSVKLMDWNSIVNAGMGGAVFQKALFETGKAMHTIKDVPMGQTFEEWTAAGNTFRGSLETGWITSEVLTNTLQGFTGDLTDAQLLSMGYTAEQVAGIQELGSTGKEAATKVKTLSQLIGTIKESIGSGWSQSFRIIFGDFEQAKQLFTGVSDALGRIVGASADARNTFLQGWSDLGGRNALIMAMVNAFRGLAGIVNTVKEAFRDVFPPLTYYQLFKLTEKLRDFTEKMILSEGTLDKIKVVFEGFFSVISIGIEVIKGLAGFVGDLFEKFSSSGASGGLVDFATGLAEGLIHLKEALVDGGAIKKFFDDLPGSIATFVSSLSFDNVVGKLVEALGKAKDALVGVFTSFDPAVPQAISDATDRVRERFGWVVDAAHAVGDGWDWLRGKFGLLKDIVSGFGDFITETFGDIPQKIADALSKSDYSTALDTVNVGLFGGLVLLVKNFLGNGLDFGGGIFEKIGKTFDTLTSTLESMQTKVKSEALFNIAKALGLLTASIVVLSMIDSAALTKSMTAMAIGFGQLIASMALLTKVSSGISGNVGIAMLSAGLITLSGAILILSVAAKIFSTMSWEDLGKGIASISVLLGALALVVQPLSANSGGMIRAGIGISALAVGIDLLAVAVKIFGTMSWETIAKGLLGVSVLLLAVAESTDRMPKGMLAKGLGIIAIAVGVNILAAAVAIFGSMDLTTMAKGIGAISLMLVSLAGAVSLMPDNLILQGVGLVAIAAALLMMSSAVKLLGSMSLKDLAKGVGGIAVVMFTLALAAEAMQGAIGGALALAVMSASLVALAMAVSMFANLGFMDLVIGLGALAAVCFIMVAAAGALAPLSPALAAVGVGLLMVAGAAVLFGAGAFLAASAFAVLATAGVQGVATIIGVLDALIEHLPTIIVAFGDGIIQLAKKILDALPEIIGALSEVIGALLQLVIDNVPPFAEAFLVILQAIIRVIREAVPEIITLGMELLLSFLRGMVDNIVEVTNTAVSIILKFLETLTGRIGDIVAKGAELLAAFLRGMANNIGKVASAAIDVVVKFLDTVASRVGDVIAAGTNIIVKIVEGIGNGLIKVTTAAVDMVIAFIESVENNINKIIQAGWDLIIGVIEGITNSIDSNLPRLKKAGWDLADAVIDGVIGGVKDLAGKAFDSIKNFAKSLLSSALGVLGIHSPSREFYKIGGHIVAGLANGVSENAFRGIASAEQLASDVLSTFGDSVARVPSILGDIGDLNPTITPVLDLTDIVKGAKQMDGIFGGERGFSPSASFMQASILATSNESTQPDTPESPTRPSEVIFNQTINAPTELSVADIYRQTRNQFAIAREELALV